MLYLITLNEEWIRWSNFILSFIALASLTANMTARRSVINRRTRRVMWWIYALFLYTTYESAIAIANDTPVTYLTYLGIFVFLGVIGSLVWHPAGDDQPPPYDGSAGQWIINQFSHAYRVLSDKYNQKKSA